MFDLSKYVEADKLAEAQAAYDADVDGLKANKSLILAENIELKKVVAARDLAIATAEQEAEVLRAEKGDSGADLLLAQQNLQQAKDDHASALLSINSEHAIKQGTNEFLKAFKADDMTQTYMSLKFNESVNFVDGALKPKDTALTMEQLQANFVKDERYAGNVVVNLGSGAGAQGGQGGFIKGEDTKKTSNKTNGYLATL
tara:strand:- start:1314 stop:1913 length:600 start_codon:yes stop_codon:yes gene_type:complete